ncbi:hypothetical protein G7Y89_g13910 [Cudoniella acicularis]|uniref:Uncharacterized protein n=1 Tax=Cudoniella acicularis TaxID=354080 RepID=A0A8H4R9Q8_9HELO|nr:hypothetical protein G7Y89_g13910 [Cudoniella acicularis]
MCAVNRFRTKRLQGMADGRVFHNQAGESVRNETDLGGESSNRGGGTRLGSQARTESGTQEEAGRATVTNGLGRGLNREQEPNILDGRDQGQLGGELPGTFGGGFYESPDELDGDNDTQGNDETSGTTTGSSEEEGDNTEERHENLNLGNGGPGEPVNANMSEGSEENDVVPDLYDPNADWAARAGVRRPAPAYDYANQEDLDSHESFSEDNNPPEVSEDGTFIFRRRNSEDDSSPDDDYSPEVSEDGTITFRRRRNSITHPRGRRQGTKTAQKILGAVLGVGVVSAKPRHGESQLHMTRRPHAARPRRSSRSQPPIIVVPAAAPLPRPGEFQQARVFHEAVPQGAGVGADQYQGLGAGAGIQQPGPYGYGAPVQPPGIYQPAGPHWAQQQAGGMPQGGYAAGGNY